MLTERQLKEASARTLSLLSRHGKTAAVRRQAIAEISRREKSWRIHGADR